MAFATQTKSPHIVGVSDTDHHAGFLIEKLIAGNNITLTQNNIGGNETLTISSTGGGGGGGSTLSTQTLVGTMNGINTVFTFASAIAGKSFIGLNGEIKEENIHYTVSGTSVTYVTPPAADLDGSPHVIHHVGFASATSITFAAGTGSIDGSNQTFSTVATPQFVVVDGVPYFSGSGYTYSAPDIVSDFAPTVGSYVYYAYGSTLATETPSGTVDGINTSFTVVNVPDFIVSDNRLFTDGNGYTRVGLSITFDVAPSIAPTSVYNSNLTVDTPIGAIDGSNASYTVPHTPQFVVLNGIIMFSGYGYTLLSGTITIDMAPAVGSSLVYLY